jgi:hypothetical protein
MKSRLPVAGGMVNPGLFVTAARFAGARIVVDKSTRLFALLTAHTPCTPAASRAQAKQPASRAALGFQPDVTPDAESDVSLTPIVCKAVAQQMLTTVAG